MSQEKVATSGETYGSLSERERLEIENAAAEHLTERLKSQSGEKNQHSEAIIAAKDAAEHARSSNQEKSVANHERDRVRAHTPTKREQSRAYESVMHDVRDHLSPSSRAFSRVIHSPVVERASDAIGSTIARPNAILAGGISAFGLSLAVYLVARYYGYPLSGTESIAAFIAGWVVGTAFDFLRIMLTGKRT